MVPFSIILVGGIFDYYLHLRTKIVKKHEFPRNLPQSAYTTVIGT